MILVSVRFLANRHILLVIGDLREIQTETKWAILGQMEFYNWLYI